MIKATDLRIGNILYIDSMTFKECPITVGSIFEKGINGVPPETGQTVQYMFAHLKPIPLDEKLLEKCGLEKHKGGSTQDRMYYHYTMMDSNDNESLNGGSVMLAQKGDCYLLEIAVEEYSECYVGHEIRFLHQLQNLYFALTGEELAVNIGTPVA